MTAKSPSTNVLLVTEEYVDRERGHAKGYKGAYEDMKARAESAEAEIDGLTARAEKAEAELAALTAERKANAVDALKQAIFETLQTLASAWPNGRDPVFPIMGGGGRPRSRCHRAARAGGRRRSASFLQGQNRAHQGRADNRVARVRPLGVGAVVGRVGTDIPGLSGNAVASRARAGVERPGRAHEPAGGRKPPAVPLSPSSRGSPSGRSIGAFTWYS